MKIQFCGGAGSVTGSCFYVTTEDARFLVDCGMFQGSKELKERNYGSFLFNPADIDFVLLTHAHVDHSGLIPKLYKMGFRGDVHTTKATKELCAIILPDSGHIQESEVERKNRKLARSGQPLLEPIYTMMDARQCLPHIKGYSYRQEIAITPNIRVRFLDAGHILGSAMIEVCLKEGDNQKKLVFSGDIGNINQPLVEDPTKIKKTDILIMEATYGNRYHLEAENKLEALARVIKNTYKKGGNLVIPSFAVERTQDLIYGIKELQEKGQIPHMQIYIDSPMAVEATKVFINNPECFDEEACIRMRGEDARSLFEGPGINYVTSLEQSIALNKIKGGAIIISASGMADAGRIKHHLKHNLWRPESTVLFVGYQAEGTLGRRILEGEKKVRIHGEEIAVKATIEKIDGFSAHADQKALVEWVQGFVEKPEKVILVHGEEDSLKTLQRVLQSELSLNVEIASYGGIYEPGREEASLPPAREKTVSIPTPPGLPEAFGIIKEALQQQAGLPGQDIRAFQRMMAQINEIERELRSAS